MIQLFDDAQSYWKIDFTNLGGGLEAEVNDSESDDPVEEVMLFLEFQ